MTTLLLNSNIVGGNQIDTWRCRSCYEGVGLKDIIETRIDNLLLWDIIKYCTNETISLDKKLPLKLCNSCFEKFKDAYFFIKEFRQIQKKFLENIPSNDYEHKIDIHDDFEGFLNSSETGTNIPSANGNKTKADEFSKFLNEFEIKTTPDLFKKKFRRISPIFEELCVTLAENRKQLLRPDAKNIYVKTKQHKKSTENDNPKINGANDGLGVEDLNESENIEEILRQHIESYTTSEVNADSNCEIYTVSSDIPEESMSKFVKHLIHTDPRKEPNTQCFECLTVFPTGADLRRHSKETGHDIAPRYKCSICGKLFKFRHKYKSHVKKHATQTDDSVCEICGACVRTTNLPRHMQRHGSGNTCHVCGKQFTQKAYLTMHMKKHESTDGPRKELCHICGVQRNNLSGLNKHMNEKHGEETNWSHQCEICNVSFFSSFSLKLHVQKMHEQKSLCKQISKRIKPVRTVKNSVDGTEIKEETGAEKRKAEGKKIVQCSICLKHMATATYYLHMRIHKGLKPYQCKVCSKTFRQCHHLKSHMNIHLNIKPYECEYCKKCFRHQTTLIIHRRSHTGETPYVCRFCSKGFAHSSSMKKHEEVHFKKRIAKYEDV